MNNRDIKHLFDSIETKPSPSFRESLGNRVLAVAPEEKPYVAFTFLRPLAMGVFALLLLVVGTTQFLVKSPQTALANAIKNTFVFEDGAYHYQKLLTTYKTLNQSDNAFIREFWQDDSNAILQSTQGDQVYSQYYDELTGEVCVYETGVTQPECEQSLFSVEDYFVNDGSLQLLDITFETSNGDPYGAHYLTWKTAEPLGKTVLKISDGGPYGVIGGWFSGTYDWVDEQGEYVYRATMQDPSMNFFGDETSFLVQIAEVDSTFDGAMPIESQQSTNVFLVDLVDKSVKQVSDEWLENSRSEYTAMMIEWAVDTDLIQQEYEDNFAEAIAILEHPEDYEIISKNEGSPNGTKQVTQRYKVLNPANYSQEWRVDVVEFVFNPDTLLVTKLTLFNTKGEVIQEVELLVTESHAETPDGIFGKENWLRNLSAK